MLEFTTIGLQIVLPGALLTWMFVGPPRSHLAFILLSLSSLLVLIALELTAIWIVPPWWTPTIYFGLWVLVLLFRGPAIWRGSNYLPGRYIEYVALLIILPFGVWASLLIAQAWSGRLLPDSSSNVNLQFPLGPGTYLIANGGSHKSINGHFFTLQPQTERQRAYRGQSFAVDLVKLNRWGWRANGWRPVNPADYYIFGEPVYAPCSGLVVAAGDGMPDMRVPEFDRSRLEGNFIFLDCGGYAVLVAHLQQGSVLVNAQDLVKVGDQIGLVGNSGQTFEPHLHIHAQTLSPDGAPLLSGSPLHIQFEGKFPVRNSRIHQN